MRNEFVKSLNGYVTVQVIGRYPERWLNQSMREGLRIWNVHYENEQDLYFDIVLSDIHKLRRLFRHSGCKVTFKQRHGLPFLIRKMKVRSGFTLGLAIFLFLLLLSANMVWGFTIKGASPHVEQELREVVEEIGIKKGAFAFQLPQPDEIQRIVTEQIDEATWIGVRKKGTTYEFEVVEQVRQEAAERLSPRHLVAAKEAVIRKMFVEDGKAVKRTNDVVQKGDLLVSGYIGAEGKEQTVAAKASVIGEIWYTSSVTIPFENTFTTITGEQKDKRFLAIGDFNVPFWNFSAPEYKTYETFERETEFSILGYKLPVQIKTVEQRETLAFSRTYTKEEAVEAAKKQAQQELRGNLPDDAEVKSEQILQEDVENDKVSLKIHYQVLEEIVQEKPIIQGD